MIICDTREKKNSHVLSYFGRNGIQYEIRTMDTADYMDPDRPGVLVDRKRNLDELAANLCTRDSGRFWREIARSKDMGARLVVLCEHGGQYRSIEDVKAWRSKYSRITGRMLASRMYKAHIAYGVEFLFCSKRQTGRMIAEILAESPECPEMPTESP